MGQIKPPLLREELMSSRRQLAVDRSLVNEAFNQDYTQGIDLAYTGERLGFRVTVHDGIRTVNTTALSEDPASAFTGRASTWWPGTGGRPATSPPRGAGRRACFWASPPTTSRTSREPATVCSWT